MGLNQKEESRCEFEGDGNKREVVYPRMGGKEAWSDCARIQVTSTAFRLGSSGNIEIDNRVDSIPFQIPSDKCWAPGFFCICLKSSGLLLTRGET